MGMLCPKCGKEAGQSKFCPHCGSCIEEVKAPSANQTIGYQYGVSHRKKKKHKVLPIVLAVIVFFIAIVAIFGQESNPKQVGTLETENPSVTESTAPSEAQKEVFAVGDIVELNGVNVTLLSVNESTGTQYMTPEDGKVFVTFEFDIDNQTDSDIAVSSMLSFEAYFDDYSTSLSLSAMVSNDKSQLDGTVAAGKKMTGVVGYEAPADWEIAEIRFTPNFWNGNDIIFEYSK